MGKIVSSTFVSLDGVINHMDRWHFDFIDTESDAIALRQLQDSQALLMGRHTYETFAQVWPGRDGEYADRINAMAKYVASRTLHNPTWTNTTVLDRGPGRSGHQTQAGSRQEPAHVRIRPGRQVPATPRPAGRTDPVGSSHARRSRHPRRHDLARA